jgi:transcriptional regulator with XRE-family HTH domain
MSTRRKKSHASRRAPKYKDGPTFQAIRQRLDGRWTQNRLARRLAIRQPVISAWEQGKAEPSPKMCLKFARLPLDKADIKWLLLKAGVDSVSLESAADRLLQERHMPVGADNIKVRPLPKIEMDKADLALPAWMVPRPLATYYVRVRDDFMRPLYRSGDIFVVDTSERDLFKLEEGSPIAVYRSPEFAEEQERRREEVEKLNTHEDMERRREHGAHPFRHIGVFVGWLRREFEPGHHTLYLLDAPRPGQPAIVVTELVRTKVEPEFIEDVTKRYGRPFGGVLGEQMEVLGRVIAWIAVDQKTARPEKGSGKSKR